MSLILYQETAEPLLPPGPAPLGPGPETWSAIYPEFIEPYEFPLDTYRTYAAENVSSYLLIPFTGNKLMAPVTIGESWIDHFSSRGWSTIQDQVNAGYPIYVQPVPQYGHYTEIVDYGAVFSNIIVNVDWGTAIVFGTVNVTCQLEYSLDGLSWSSPHIGTTLFVTSMRYLRITINFEAVN